jgi:hypothetical protein
VYVRRSLSRRMARRSSRGSHAFWLGYEPVHRFGFRASRFTGFASLTHTSFVLLVTLVCNPL